MVALACSPGSPPFEPVTNAAEPPTPVADPPPPDVTPALTMAVSVGLWRGKPPLANLYFDVGLHNPAAAPRWLILPQTFPYTGQDTPRPGGELAELQVYRTSEQPHTILAKGVGGNFWALLLPAGGDITIRGLPIQSWWETMPTTTTLELLVASEVMVGDRSLADSISGVALSESGADVQAPRDAADPRAQAFWHPDDPSSSAPLRIDVESRETIEVTLDLGPPPPREP